MLRPDVVVVQEPRFLLRLARRPPRAVGEPLERRQVARATEESPALAMFTFSGRPGPRSGWLAIHVSIAVRDQIRPAVSSTSGAGKSS